MTDSELFFQALIRPLTEATVLGSILAGVIMGSVYWRKIRVSFFNGFMFNLAFFVAVYLSRRYVDGISSSAGYLGIFILYCIFLTSAWLVNVAFTSFRPKQ